MADLRYFHFQYCVKMKPFQNHYLRSAPISNIPTIHFDFASFARNWFHEVVWVFPESDSLFFKTYLRLRHDFIRHCYRVYTLQSMHLTVSNISISKIIAASVATIRCYWSSSISTICLKYSIFNNSAFKHSRTVTDSSKTIFLIASEFLRTNLARDN